MARTVSEWVGKSDDTIPPPRVCLRITIRCDERCQDCGRKVGAGLRYAFDHIVALINGGENREGNIQILCEECHKKKTRLDVAEKSRVNRIRSKHLGIKKRTSRPMPGSRASGWKKPFNSPPVRRV